MAVVVKWCCQRCHEERLSQQDLNKSLGWWPIKVYVGQAQLLYLGHVARLPADRPERVALFGWLQVELRYNTNRRGSKSRGQLWQRLLELLALAGVSAAEAASKWEAIASENASARWSSLVKQWFKKQASAADDGTWLARHKDAASRGRTEAAEERVWADLGARPVSGGKFACPFCLDPLVMQFPHSLRSHIEICKDLPHEVRVRQAEQRRMKTGCLHKEALTTSAPAASSVAQPAASSSDYAQRAQPTEPAKERALSPTRRRLSLCSSFQVVRDLETKGHFGLKLVIKTEQNLHLCNVPVSQAFSEEFDASLCRDG